MSAAKRTSKNGRAAKPAMATDGVAAELAVRRAEASDEIPLGFFFDTVLRKDYFVRRGQLNDILNGKYHQVHVAEIDTVLVGVAITTRGSRLVNALVHPAYRGLGIGRELVRASGATEVRAKIDMSSGDPRGFYESLGFSRTGEFNDKRNIEVMRAAGSPNGKQKATRGASSKESGGAKRARSNSRTRKNGK